jgi:ribosome-binding protein aMBF1 (putative translation factor)
MLDNLIRMLTMHIMNQRKRETIEGAAYRKARELRGISLRECARRMRISAMYLSDMERGRRYWNDRMRNKIEKALEQGTRAV